LILSVVFVDVRLNIDKSCPKHKQDHLQVEIILRPNPVLPTIGFIVERAKDILAGDLNVHV
jgi:hypothetical protein